MNRYMVCYLSSLMALSLMGSPNSAAENQNSKVDWVGDYASPKGRISFGSHVVSIRKGVGKTLHYDEYISSDVGKDRIRSGMCLTDGLKLYIPFAYSYDKNPNEIFASVKRYYFVSANGYEILLTDIAYKRFQMFNRINLSSALIKVGDSNSHASDLEKVKHPYIDKDDLVIEPEKSKGSAKSMGSGLLDKNVKPEKGFPEP